MNLDLVVGGHDLGVLEQKLEVLDREIRDADGANFACRNPIGLASPLV